MAAAVLFTDDQRRVLLAEPTYKDDWEIPGCCVEADESPLDAATRELNEELGLSIRPGRLLVVDWVPPRPGGTEGLMMVFDGGLLDPADAATIVLPPDELRSWAWCTSGEASRRLSELLARRVEAALRALATGATLYLQNGAQIAG